MKQINKNNILLKILSLFIAIVVWGYVAGTNNFQEDYKVNDIKPEFFGIEDLKNSKNLLLVGEYAVDVELSGSYSDLLSLNENDIKIEVDLAKIGITSPGTYEIPYTVTLPSSAYSLKGKNPEKLTVKFDQEKVSVIPVKVVTEDIAAKGFFVDESSVKITPNQLRLSGLQAGVDKIAYAEVDTGKKNIRAEVSGKYQYKFYDEKGNQLKDIIVEADHDVIDVKIPVFKTKTVPLVLEIQGNDNLKKYVSYTFSPKNVQLAGTESQIDAINELVVGAVKLSEISSGMEKSFMIKCPEGIINMSGVVETTATIKLEGLEKKTVQATTIQVKNAKLANADNSVKLITKRVPVTVFGTPDSLAKVNSKNVIAVADLSEVILSKGTHPVEVTAYVDGVIDVIAAGSADYPVYIEVK